MLLFVAFFGALRTKLCFCLSLALRLAKNFPVRQIFWLAQDQALLLLVIGPSTRQKFSCSSNFLACSGPSFASQSLASLRGFEPLAPSLGNLCSIHLSYRDECLVFFLKTLYHNLILTVFLFFLQVCEYQTPQNKTKPTAYKTWLILFFQNYALEF